MDIAKFWKEAIFVWFSFALLWAEIAPWADIHGTYWERLQGGFAAGVVAAIVPALIRRWLRHLKSRSDKNRSPAA